MHTRKVRHAGVTLHTEAFGVPKDPALLLIMGAMSSGRWWPDELCMRLAAGGRFVIRYDHRDTGESDSYPPGAAPYKVEDLADDAVAVLDGYNVQRAHVAGMSLGGYLAQLVALKSPTRVLSLVLIASERLAAADATLPGIAPELLEYHRQWSSLDWSDRDAVVAYQVGAWRLQAGPGRAFEADAVARIAAVDHARTRTPASALNHATLGDAAGRWLGRLQEIRVPVTVIHGTHDPVLPYAHGLALHSAIRHSSLVPLDGAGHELHRSDWDSIVAAVDRQLA